MKVIIFSGVTRKTTSIGTFAFLLVMFALTAAVSAQRNDYARAHLWEKEIAAFAELDRQTAPPRQGVLFVGSSSIRGWKTLAADFPQLKVLNRGFGGSHFEDVAHYAGQIVLPYKPKLIVLYAGENDLTAGKSVERVFADFRRFLEEVRENLPQTRVIVISAKPSPARWNQAERFKELNRLMKSETERDKRLFFLDVWTLMLDANGLPKGELFLGDKLHMNAAGYKIWRAALDEPIKIGLKKNFR